MFYVNFINQCAKLKVTPAKVAREIGVSGAAVSKWKSGSKPSDVTLAKLAEYFGVSVDELLAGAETPETKKAPDYESEDDELNELLEELKNNPGKRLLFSKTKSATKEDIEKIIAMVDILTGGKDNGGYFY